jgi:predicted aspartyl protease
MQSSTVSTKSLAFTKTANNHHWNITMMNAMGTMLTTMTTTRMIKRVAMLTLMFSCCILPVFGFVVLVASVRGTVSRASLAKAWRDIVQAVIKGNEKEKTEDDSEDEFNIEICEDRGASEMVVV